VHIIVVINSEYDILNVKNLRHGKCAKFNVVGMCENGNHPQKLLYKW
jgi:hypothetical protein